MNSYGYVEQNPVIWTDSEGLDPYDPGKAPADPTPKARGRNMVCPPGKTCMNGPNGLVAPWLPSNLANPPIYCKPYYKVHISGFFRRKYGMIPLVKEEIFDCGKKIICSYKGRIATRFGTGTNHHRIRYIGYTARVVIHK